MKTNRPTLLITADDPGDRYINRDSLEISPDEIGELLTFFGAPLSGSFGQLKEVNIWIKAPKGEALLAQRQRKSLLAFWNQRSQRPLTPDQMEKVRSLQLIWE